MWRQRVSFLTIRMVLNHMLLPRSYISSLSIIKYRTAKFCNTAYMVEVELWQCCVQNDQLNPHCLWLISQVRCCSIFIHDVYVDWNITEINYSPKCYFGRLWDYIWGYAPYRKQMISFPWSSKCLNAYCHRTPTHLMAKQSITWKYIHLICP